MNWFWLSGVIIVFDQLTKQLSENLLQLYQPVDVFTGFNLTLMYNKGAAFSFLSSAGGWQRWFFMVLSAAVSIFLFVWLKKIDAHKKWLAAGIALILGGAVGNLIDRTIYGHVIDFIQVYYYADSCMIGFSHIYQYGESLCVWPTFNIADSAISAGAVLLIIDMIRDYRHHA